MLEAPHDSSPCMKVEINEVCTSILLLILSDIVSITPAVAATLTIIVDKEGDNSSLSDNEHVGAGLNEDVDVDAGMLNAIYDLSAGVSDNDDENDGQDDSAESQQGWNILMGSRRPSSVSISLDGVDSRQLKKAWHEVPEVIKRIKEKLFGNKKKNRDMLQVSSGDFLRAFMDPTLLGLIKTFINKNISRDPASSSEIIAFLHVKLMRSFNNVRRSKCQDRSSKGEVILYNNIY